MNDPGAVDVYFFAGWTRVDLDRKLQAYARENWETVELDAGPIRDLKTAKVVELYFQHSPESLWWEKVIL